VKLDLSLSTLANFIIYRIKDFLELTTRFFSLHDHRYCVQKNSTCMMICGTQYSSERKTVCPSTLDASDVFRQESLTAVQSITNSEYPVSNK